MSRYIDADALKDKLQQHHDFYVMAWGGFGKMPIGEKKRVDEITNCIAEVVNAPTIEPKRGEWIDAEIPLESGGSMPIQACNLCKTFYPLAYTGGGHRFCPNCGAHMKGADDEADNN